VHVEPTVVEDSLILALLSFAVDFCDFFFVDYNGGRPPAVEINNSI